MKSVHRRGLEREDEREARDQLNPRNMIIKKRIRG